MNEKNPVFAIFADCLHPSEAQEQDFLGKIYKGKVSTPVPRVTPPILGSVLTGEEPTNSGLLCPTRFRKENLTRPLTRTLVEELGEEYRVLSFEVPFTLGQNPRFGVNIGSAPNIVQEQRPGELALPRPQAQLWNSENEDGKLEEEEKEKILQGFVDYCRNLFSTVRNLARNNQFDFFLLSYRQIDSLGHFLFPSQRERLVRYLSFELAEISMMGDVDLLFFSDHGIEPKKETFFINEWLKEKGYLETRVLEGKMERQRRQQQEGEPLTQVSVHSPFVEVTGDSQVLSNDAYDSGLSVLDDSLDVEDLKDDLMGTGFYDGIYEIEEYYDGGKYGPETLGIDLITDRADAVLVSGNVHPALDGVTASEASILCQGKIRNGVHTRYGCWGTTDDVLDEAELEPTELHSVIKKFVQRNAPKPSAEDLYGTKEMAKREEEIRGRLEDLGYL